MSGAMRNVRHHRLHFRFIFISTVMVRDTSSESASETSRYPEHHQPLLRSIDLGDSRQQARFESTDVVVKPVFPRAKFTFVRCPEYLNQFLPVQTQL